MHNNVRTHGPRQETTEKTAERLCDRVNASTGPTALLLLRIFRLSRKLQFAETDSPQTQEDQVQVVFSHSNLRNILDLSPSHDFCCKCFDNKNKSCVPLNDQLMKKISFWSKYQNL